MDYYNAGENVTNQYGGRLGPWAQDRYMPRVKTRYHLKAELLPFDFDEIISTMAPRAFFSSSPLHDGNFSVEGVRKAAGNIAEVYGFMQASGNFTVIYPACGHDFPLNIRLQAYDFVDRFLK